MTRWKEIDICWRYWWEIDGSWRQWFYSNKVPRELSSDDEMATDVEIVFPIELMNMNRLEDWTYICDNAESGEDLDEEDKESTTFCECGWGYIYKNVLMIHPNSIHHRSYHTTTRILITIQSYWHSITNKHSLLPFSEVGWFYSYVSAKYISISMYIRATTV